MIKSLSNPGINCKRLCLFLSDTSTDADSSILLKNSTKHVNNLGLYYTKAQSLSDDRKLELQKNSWTPPRAYNFPKTQFYGKKRAFSFEWLSQFTWLIYCAAQDGAFCHFCVLFGRLTGRNSDPLDKLYKSPFRNWVSPSTKSKEHQPNSEFHKAAADCAEDFLPVQEGKMLCQSSSVIFIVTLSNLTDRSYDLSLKLLCFVVFCQRPKKCNIPLQDDPELDHRSVRHLHSRQARCRDY